MPKKFKGENSKAMEARARKEAKKTEEREKKEQAMADEFWKDDDKHVQRKQQRKDDREKKKAEQLERKKENQKLAEEEMSSMKSAKERAPTNKLTRADIAAGKDRRAAEAAAATKNESVTADELPIEENLNRLQMEEGGARSVDEALSVLSSKEEDVDMHPERRMKAAYLAYEEKNLPILKAENPNMRLSQLKQQLKKEWMKSPENPLIKQQMALRNK